MPRTKSKPPQTSPRRTVAAAPAAAAERMEMKDDVNTFPSKTYDMIDHCDRHNPEVACWAADGAAFVVKDVPALESSYLPKKFDHSNFQSFVRQLNLYGFRNVSKEKEGTPASASASAWSAAATSDPAAARSNGQGSGGGDGTNAPHIVFRHDNFKRGRRDLLSNIQRSKKGDRSQRRTRQEEELHAVSAALNLRFDAVDTEVTALHAKVDRLSAKLDKALDLFLTTTMTTAAVASAAQQKQQGADDDRGRRCASQGKKRRLTDGNGGRIADSMAEDERHSAGASSTGDSGDAVGGVPAGRRVFGFVPRNISPACSETNQGSLPPPQLPPLPPGEVPVASVTDESNTKDMPADGHGGVGPFYREPGHDALGIAAAPFAGGVGHGDDAAASELDDDNFLEECKKVLGDDADDELGYRRPDDDDNVDNDNAAGAQQTPRGGAGEGGEGNPPAGRRPNPSEIRMMDPELGDLDAMSLALDSFEGGSSSLSADEILTSFPGSRDLHMAAVFDHGNAAAAAAAVAPPSPVTVHYRQSDGRYGDRRFFGHRTLLAGITLMSAIAAIAVGVMFSVGRHMHDAPAPAPAPAPSEPEPEKVPWRPPEDGPSLGGNGGPVMTPPSDGPSGPEPIPGAPGKGTGSDKADDADAGGGGSSRPTHFLSVTPTPAPSSQRDTVADWDSVAPSTSAPTIRF